LRDPVVGWLSAVETACWLARCAALENEERLS
jgi:hypothetical protein